jgi:DNA-binding response OmpR family regulator
MIWRARNSFMEDRPAPTNLLKAEEQKRGKLLLVDDDTGVRASLSRALESENYSVVPVGNGEEALRWIRGASFDLVLLDLDELGEMNGWELFAQIVAIHPSLPIMVTAALPDQSERAARAGAAAIMEKPLSLPVLIETIDGLLQRSAEVVRATDFDSEIGRCGRLRERRQANAAKENIFVEPSAGT